MQPKMVIGSSCALKTLRMELHVWFSYTETQHKILMFWIIYQWLMDLIYCFIYLFS